MKWKLVPEEPTEDMLIAGQEEYVLGRKGAIEDCIESADIYKAMIESAPKHDSEWMPIETAPKDGTRILLYRPLAEATHDEKIDIKRGTPINHGCWAETIPSGSNGVNYTDGYCFATHWMHLPDAPK
jgi:hypothetical protein